MHGSTCKFHVDREKCTCQEETLRPKHEDAYVYQLCSDKSVCPSRVLGQTGLSGHKKFVRASLSEHCPSKTISRLKVCPSIVRALLLGQTFCDARTN